MTSPVVLYREESNLRIAHLATPAPLVAHVRISVHCKDMHRVNKLLLGFYADMLEKGSKQFSKDAYEEALESLGADVDISSAGNTVSISIVVRAETLTRVLSILKATLTGPRMSAGEIQKLKKEYAQGFHELQNDTRHLASALLSRTLYNAEDEEYVPTIREREAALAKIDRKALLDTHARFGKGEWSVTVSGTKKVFDAVRRFVLASVDEKAVNGRGIEERLLPVPPETLLEQVPGKQNVELSIGNHVPLLPMDPEYTPFAFGIDVLGKRGGFAGRLMSTVREKEGLTYSIYAWLSGADALRSGQVVIWTFFTPKDIEKGLSSTMREVKKIAAKGVTDAEVAQFKTLLSNQFTLTYESVKGTTALYHSALVRRLTPEFIEGYPQRVAALTKKEINTALRTYLDPAKLVIAGAGTLKKIPKVA